jgi:hypothetical protein
MKIYIHGKAYKPEVPYCEGSYSLLVGHYCEKMGYTPTYIDPLTGDNLDECYGVVLLAHSAKTTYQYWRECADALYCNILPNSVVVDPWRAYVNDKVKVVHYGNTRQ